MTTTRAFVLFSASSLGLLGPSLLPPGPPSALADGDKGLEVGTQIDRAWCGYKSEQSEIEIELVSTTGERVTRKMRGKLKEEGREERALITIVWPADQKDTRLLSWSHRTKDDDQWLYLPSIKRTKRISAHGRSGSFIGSEFSFEDLINIWWVDKYRYKYLRDQAVGPRQTWVVERYPRDPDSGYSKQVAWIDKEYMTSLRIDFYDRKGALLKTADFRSFKKYGDKWRADRIEMVNRQTGRKSTVVWKARQLGVDLSDADFSPDSMAL